MIIRYYTLCPGCNAKTILRLQVGIDEHQPFYFVCEKCGVATRGSLEVDYDADPPDAHLQLEDGVIFESIIENPDQTITIALDLPCVLVGGESPASQYPFIYQAELMGGLGRVMQFQQRLSMFRGFVDSDWPRVRRLITYYVNRNWQQLDAEWANIFTKDTWLPPTNDLERHDYVHRALEMLFGPLQLEFDYPILKGEINGFITKLAEEKREVLRGFSQYLTNTKDLAQYQRNLLDRLAFVIDNFSSLSPGFPMLFYEAGGKRDVGKLRIMRDDFEVLKAHYLSCFEIAYKVLGILIGLLNINARGNANAFPNEKPSSLKKFNELPNAQKPSFIDGNVVPEIASRWGGYFDRQLRNAIGHYSVHHDLKTGMLVLDDAPPIPYSEFVASTLKMTPMLFYCLQLVKMVYVTRWFLK